MITIGQWLKDAQQLEVKGGFARLIWDEARHTKIWTERMIELVGERQVDRHYPDPRRVEIQNPEYFRLWDEYAKADSLAKRLAYIYVVDAWAGFAYTAYLILIDPVTKWHLQTILADECFHVSFGEQTAAKYVTSEKDKEALALAGALWNAVGAPPTVLAGAAFAALTMLGVLAYRPPSTRWTGSQEFSRVDLQWRIDCERETRGSRRLPDGLGARAVSPAMMERVRPKTAAYDSALAMRVTDARH